MSKELVLEQIKKQGKPVNVWDIVKASGLEKEVVAKAFEELKKDGLIYSPIRCKYQAK